MNKHTRDRFITLLRYIVVIFWLLFTLTPIYIALVASLTKYENLGQTFLYPKDFNWVNYINVFKHIPMFEYFKSSLIYSIGTAIICVTLATFAAYALSRFNFKGKLTYTISLFVTQLLPQVVIVVPVFLLLNKVGLYDGYLGVVIVITATSMAFPTLLLKSFFDELPIELEQAASIDGASTMTILFKIVLPLAAPGIATAFALAFFTGWGQYLLPLVLTTSENFTPLTVGVSRLIDSQTPWDIVMAGSIVSIIPPIIFYLFVQKLLIKGLSAGSVK